MKRDLIFYNAIAKYNESKLLKREQITRLISATDYNEALKMLYDYGYIRIGDQDMDSFITAQINALIDYVYSDCPSKSLERVILNPFYYSNAKLYYKNTILNQEENQYIYQLNDEHILSSIKSGDYLGLDKYMRECILSLNERQERNGRIIDIEFDRALYKSNLDCTRLTLKRELRQFVLAQIDLNNFLTFLRCRGLNKDFDFLSQMLIKGGKINLSLYKESYNLLDKEIIEAFSISPYKEIIEKMVNKRINLDLGIDSLLIQISLKNNLSMTSFSPFLSYYYRKLTELRVVKMTLTLIKNGLKEQIEGRLKGIYE